jgi:hypothetical protein
MKRQTAKKKKKQKVESKKPWKRGKSSENKIPILSHPP